MPPDSAGSADQDRMTGSAASPRLDYVWRSVPPPFQISGAATTQRWFMPASSTYVRVPFGVISNA